MVEASNYHHQEDEPDMSNPATALDMYTSQKQTLPTLEQVLTVVQRIEGQLGGIYDIAVANNLPAVTKEVEKVWQKTQQLHQHIQRQDATLRGGEAVIEAVIEQRDDLLSEMADLTKAIAEGNEAHPKLKEYAENIRQEEAEYQQEYAEESAFEYASEVMSDTLHENLIDLTELDWHTVDAALDIIRGYATPSEVQLAALVAFVKTCADPQRLINARELELRRQHEMRVQQAAAFDTAELETEDDAEEFDVDD